MLHRLARKAELHKYAKRACSLRAPVAADNHGAESSSATLPCLPTKLAPSSSGRGAHDRTRPFGLLSSNSVCGMCQAWESTCSSAGRSPSSRGHGCRQPMPGLTASPSAMRRLQRTFSLRHACHQWEVQRARPVGQFLSCWTVPPRYEPCCHLR